jgi:hypothetical protein
MKKLLTLVFFGLTLQAYAICDCLIGGRPTKANTSVYDLIFTGKVDSLVVSGENPRVWLRVTAVYKGVVLKHTPLFFEAVGECSMKFEKGQEWIIYADYERYGEAAVDYCSRSRRRIDNERMDMYLETSGVTFDGEIQFLEKNYKRSAPVEMKNDQQPIPERHNEIPKGWTPVWLLLASTAGAVTLYWLARKFWK